MFTKAFWKAATERAVKTAAQAAGLAIGQDVFGFNVFDVKVEHVIGAALGGAVLSLLSSLGSIPLSAGNSPSLAPAAEVAAAKS